jgi:hypothetical protein
MPLKLRTSICLILNELPPQKRYALVGLTVVRWISQRRRIICQPCRLEGLGAVGEISPPSRYTRASPRIC